MIGTAELIALLPLEVLATGTLVVMLLSAFIRQTRHCHLVVMVLTSATLVLTLASLPIAAQQAPLRVTPILLIDHYGLMMSGLLLCAALAVCWLAYPYWQGRRVHREEFYLLLLIGTFGTLVLSCAHHFVGLLLGLETLGVTLFAMIAYSSRIELPPHITHSAPLDHSLEAGLKYLVLSGVASAILFFGIALLYLETGHMDFAGFAGKQTASAVYTAGLVLLLAGIAFKLSLFPFHLWTPDVYQGAPAPVTAFLATLSKAAIFSALLRFFVVSDNLAQSPVALAIAIIAGLSMIAGNWLALLQDNLKRLLAYSSIAHLGYILIVFLTLQSRQEALAVEAAVVYLMAYMATSLVAFGIVCLLSSDRRQSSEECGELADYRGLFWHHPLIALALTAALLSLAGLPLTFGFIGKFYLFAVAIQAELWGLLATLVIGSAIGLFYYLRTISTLFKGADIPSDPLPWQLRPLHLSACLLITALSLGLIAFGLYPQPLLAPLQQLTGTLVEPAANLAVHGTIPDTR